MPGFFGKALRGLGMLGKKKKPQPVKNPDLTDDGGPYVRAQKHSAKKAKDKGTIYNRAGHVADTPSPHAGGRTKESIKKYHGIK